MTTDKILLTQEGKNKLENELRLLVEDKRPKVVERLSVARMAGDLSENNAYTSAKEELEFIDRRIDELEVTLKLCEVIKPNGRKNKSVCLGCRVVVHNGTGEHEFCIVGEWEADPTNKKISHTSPLGQALMDKTVGERVDVEAPAGKVTYKILAIN